MIQWEKKSVYMEDRCSEFSYAPRRLYFSMKEKSTTRSLGVFKSEKCYKKFIGPVISTCFSLRCMREFLKSVNCS